MAQSAYQYSTSPRRETTPRVNYTQGRRAQESPRPTSISFVFGAIALVAVVIAAVCVVRVFLSATTVQTALAAQQVETQLEDARSTGTTLEVQETTLSSSTRIKTEATTLGMTAPEEVVAIVLPADPMVTDAQGNLSLTGSIAVAVSEA